MNEKLAEILSDCAKFPLDLAKVQPAVNLLFANASNAELLQLLSYLRNSVNSEMTKKIFFNTLSFPTWERFLRVLPLEELSMLNLAAIAKESAALRQALVNWLEENIIKQAGEGFWDFVQKEALFAIPGLMDLVLSGKDVSTSRFLSTFVNRANQDQDFLVSFLIPVTMDANALLPIETLSLYDQLLAYGFLMFYVAARKQLLEGMLQQDQAGSSAQVPFEKVEAIKVKYIVKSRWLTWIDEQKCFPEGIVFVLTKALSLREYQVKRFLHGVGCLPESVFTIKDWVEEHFSWLRDKEKANGKEISLELVDNELDLSNLYQDKMSRRMLAKTLEADTYLLSLVLNKSISDIDEAKALAEALKVNTHLKKLFLSGNNLGDEGVKVLSEALKINASLKLLNLSLNSVGVDGIKALAEALKINASLVALSLKGNNLGIDSVKALVEMLGVNTHLAELYLSDSNLGDQGAVVLSETLKTNASLKVLDLNRSNIGIDGVKALAEALKTNISLVALDLRQNNFGDEGVRLLVEVLKTNTTLILYLDEMLVVNEVDSLIKRNKAYANSHEKVNKCLQTVRKKLSENENLSQKESSTSQTSKDQTNQHAIQDALTEALEEVMKLYDAIPRYRYAEALLHEVHYQTAITYTRYGDYASLIALYCDYFISHPDDMVNFNLAMLLTTLEDTIYESAGLNRNDKQQLNLVIVSRQSKTECRELSFRSIISVKRR